MVIQVFLYGHKIGVRRMAFAHLAGVLIYLFITLAYHSHCAGVVAHGISGSCRSFVRMWRALSYVVSTTARLSSSVALFRTPSIALADWRHPLHSSRLPTCKLSYSGLCPLTDFFSGLLTAR